MVNMSSHQFLGRFWLLRRLTHFQPDNLPAKRLLQIAAAKALESISILDEHHFHRLLSNEDQEFFHALAPLLKERRLAR